LIFIESSRPFPDLVPEFRWADKLLHFSAWTVLGFLFFRAYRASPSLSRHKTTLLWISFLSATLYGMSDETHQYFVPSRTADILDFFADAAGSLFGVFIGARWYALYRSPAKVPDIDSDPIRSVDKSA
jgi:VanZ family protein